MGQVEQWGKAGRKQQGCGNSWPWSARTHQGLQGIHLQAGRGLTMLRASSDIQGVQLPRMQPEQGQQEGWEVAHAWGQMGGKKGIETITGGRVWLQPVQP